MEYIIKEYEPVRMMLSKHTTDFLNWFISTTWFHDKLIETGYTEEQYDNMIESEVGREVFLGRAVDMWMELLEEAPEMCKKFKESYTISKEMTER